MVANLGIISQLCKQMSQQIDDKRRIVLRLFLVEVPHTAIISFGGSTACIATGDRCVRDDDAFTFSRYTIHQVFVDDDLADAGTCIVFLCRFHCRSCFVSDTVRLFVDDHLLAVHHIDAFGQSLGGVAHPLSFEVEHLHLVVAVEAHTVDGGDHHAEDIETRSFCAGRHLEVGTHTVDGVLAFSRTVELAVGTDEELGAVGS